MNSFDLIRVLCNTSPKAYALITGATVTGTMLAYSFEEGTIVVVEAQGLPATGCGLGKVLAVVGHRKILLVMLEDIIVRQIVHIHIILGICHLYFLRTDKLGWRYIFLNLHQSKLLGGLL